MKTWRRSRSFHCGVHWTHTWTSQLVNTYTLTYVFGVFTVIFNCITPVMKGVSAAWSRKCSKLWWNVHSCGHAWMCVYLTTVQVNLGPQSLVLCVSAKAHKPCALWSACQLWNPRRRTAFLHKLTAQASPALGRKSLKVNQSRCFCSSSPQNDCMNTSLVVKGVLFGGKMFHSSCGTVGHPKDGSTFTCTCPQA